MVSLPVFTASSASSSCFVRARSGSEALGDARRLNAMLVEVQIKVVCLQRADEGIGIVLVVGERDLP
eukprot:6208784-Prorocentrum_lima.AAC.1